MAQRKRIPGRKRRATGWMLLTLGLLVAGVWVWSGWYSYYGATGSGLNVVSGRVLWERPWGAWTWETGESTIDPQPTHIRRERDTLPYFTWRTSTEIHPSALWFYSATNIPSFGSVRPTATLHEVVLWPLPLLLWTPAALLLRSGIVARRRAITGKCKACGYDLAGLPPAADARCPECGKQQTSHG